MDVFALMLFFFCTMHAMRVMVSSQAWALPLAALSPVQTAGLRWLLCRRSWLAAFPPVLAGCWPSVLGAAGPGFLCPNQNPHLWQTAEQPS
jgi:hypothetical protein